MQLTDEQLDAIIAWAKRTPEVEAVHLYAADTTAQRDIRQPWTSRSS
jgi:hypothetical protein